MFSTYVVLEPFVCWTVRSDSCCMLMWKNVCRGEGVGLGGGERCTGGLVSMSSPVNLHMMHHPCSHLTKSVYVYNGDTHSYTFYQHLSLCQLINTVKYHNTSVSHIPSVENVAGLQPDLNLYFVIWRFLYRLTEVNPHHMVFPYCNLYPRYFCASYHGV